jgi:hypothetical protein
MVWTYKSSWLYHALNRRREEKRYRHWLHNDRRGPPPHLAKQAVLRQYQQRYQLPILVESGTYLGDMVEAMRGDFTRIISIELSSELHQRATRRFARFPAITIIQGDSGTVLAELAPQLDQGVLFWLDGHYSGGATAKGVGNTPILSELTTVMGLSSPFVVLVDDAMLFTGTDDYPSLSDLEAHVAGVRPGTLIEVETDIIRIIPPGLRILDSK